MAIVEFDSSIVMRTELRVRQYAIFEHHAVMVEGQPPELIFIGHDRLSEIYKLLTPRKNTEWSRIYANGGSVMVRIVAITNDKQEAIRYVLARIRNAEKIPICNRRGLNIRGGAQAIECIETGERFASQREACEAFGIREPNMTRHMQGLALTVGGMTFRTIAA